MTDPNQWIRRVPLDDPAMTAWHIAKSAYQIRPDVFNLECLSNETSLGRPELEARIRRLYDERLIMLVMHFEMRDFGLRTYYWSVKLREDTRHEVKEEFANWYQAKDPISTGYEARGACDFFNGSRVRVLDNLLWDVIMPLGTRPEVECLRVMPLRRILREEGIHLSTREHAWGGDEPARLAAAQEKLDSSDIAIVRALNRKRALEEYFNFDVLADVSGMDPVALRQGLEEFVERKHILTPVVFVNWQKLGLTRKLFAVRLFQIIPASRKAEIAEALAAIPEFRAVYEFSDAYHDLALITCNQTADTAALRAAIDAFPEVERIDESDLVRQFRRSNCRLDDGQGSWEQCIYADDFARDFALRGVNA